jgi:omega-amidase
MFITPYEPASIRKAAPFARSVVSGIKEMAVRHGLMIVAGSMPWEGSGGRFFNTSFVFDRSGSEIYRHDKIHLFDCSLPGGPTVRESDIVLPGDSLGTFQTDWGTASVIICYDIRFTPIVQILADRDVRLLFVPAAFSLSTGTAHWELLVRSRAIEMQGFVIGVQPACNPSLRYVPYGHSMIASPWGEVLLDAGKDETVAVARIDLESVVSIREKFPLLSHRRRDLYATSWRRDA